MRSFPLLVGLTLCSTFVPALHAQTKKSAGPEAEGSSKSTAAEELFRQGRAAVEAGDFATACDRFSASENLEPAPGTLLNVADCETHLGKLVAAKEHFELAASGFGKNDPRRAFVAGRVAEIDRRLAHLSVHLAPGLPSDAKVMRDGESFDRRTIDRAVPVDPRPSTFVVSAPGFVDRTFSLAFVEGSSNELTLDVGDRVPPPTLFDPSASSSGSGRATGRTLGFVAGGLGLAGLAAGGVLGIFALHEASVVKDHCQIPAYTCDSQGVSAGSSGQTFSLGSTVALAVGAALTVTGVVLIVVNRKPRTEHAALTLVPYFGTSGGGATAALTF